MRSWGRVLFKDGNRLESRNCWLDSSGDINSLRSLFAFRDHIRNSWVDAHTDNRTLEASLENFDCKNLSVNESFKEILLCSGQLNLAIDIYFVSSWDNVADSSTRACFDLDCMLSEKAWIWSKAVVVHIRLTSCPLSKRSLWPDAPSFFSLAFFSISRSLRLCAALSGGRNSNVFPPFCLFGPLLRYF